MMKHTFKHTLMIGSLLVFSSSILTGCFNLNYEDTQDYYDLFSDKVHLIYSNDDGTDSSETVKSLKDDFFNDETANNVDKVDTIDEEYYQYLCISPTELVTVEDFAFFVKSKETVKIEVRIYLTSEIPDTDNIRGFGCEATDPDGEEIYYSDTFGNPIFETISNTKANEWQSIYSNRWDTDDQDSRYVDVAYSQVLLVQFLNNTGYGKDLGYEPVKFSIVNLMVSPKNEKYSVETN